MGSKRGVQGQPALPQLERFSEVKPFDVRA